MLVVVVEVHTKALLTWAEDRDANAPAVDLDASGMSGARKMSHHLDASLLMSTEARTEAHSIMDNTPNDI